jgi:hypothetical protein
MPAQENGKSSLIFFASDEASILGLARRRLRLAFLLAARWRLPARLAFTLPLPDTLKRFATAFLVLAFDTPIISYLFCTCVRRDGILLFTLPLIRRRCVGRGVLFHGKSPLAFSSGERS